MSKSTRKKDHGQTTKPPTKKQLKQQVVTLPVTHANAAGIDIGDRMHAVAVPPGRGTNHRLGCLERLPVI